MSKLFLSCVTREFSAYRALITKDLRRAGVDVRVQEDFGVTGVPLLLALDDYIRECDAVIHLVGFGTGAFPEVPAVRALQARYPNMEAKLPVLAEALSLPDPRVSYTQWEAWLAIYHARKTHIYVASEATPRGVEFTASAVEQESQDEHFKHIRDLGWQRGSFENEERLSKYVLGDLRYLFRPDEPFIAEPSHLWKLQAKPGGVFEGREQVLNDLDDLWADSLAEKPGRAQIVSLVAIGGAGKTTVASRWKDSLLARESHGGVERYFDWSFYSQGTRGSDANTGAQTEADATIFVAAALKWFGDPAMADSATPAWDKGARLATLVAKRRTLLILDGLEPLQYPPGPQTGELKDDGIRALLAGLQNSGRGLCIVTTRELIADLAATRETTTPQWLLDHLTAAAGAAVLRGHDVIGSQSELEAASREVKGHALTLSLMGRYLRLAFSPPDIAQRDCFRFTEADAETQNGHAFRVFASYERWFANEGRHIEVAILRLLGLFDRPAPPDCLAALCSTPAIPGLTEPLVGLGETQWNIALNRLRELDLIETTEWVPMRVSGYGEEEARAEMAANQITDLGAPRPFESHPSSAILRVSIDAHPLMREYFDTHLMEHGIGPTGHARLYEYLSASVPYWPESRDGLLPLYQAVAHGCKAGRYQRACEDIYRDRIKRSGTGARYSYSSQKLGLFGLDLAAMACFFIKPWSQLAAELTQDAKAWLLGEAALCLCALNRLSEALEPSRAGLQLQVQREDWSNAARAASNLSELELSLGDVASADTTSARSIIYADDSGDAYIRMFSRATHAEALLQAGQSAASHNLFAEAETIQAERQPSYPLLYSWWAYEYCDHLLVACERAAWRRHAVSEVSDRLCFPLSEPGQRFTAEFAVNTAALLSELAAVERRANQTLAWAIQNRALPMNVATGQLTLGQIHLLRAVLNDAKDEASTELSQARKCLDNALARVSEAGQNQHRPNVLLPSAWLHVLLGELDAARQRLDEAFALATRGGNMRNSWQGGMTLHIVDTLLHRARLFGRLQGEYPWLGRTPKADLEEASALIDACGYHRRDEELADARTVFG